MNHLEEQLKRLMRRAEGAAPEPAAAAPPWFARRVVQQWLAGAETAGEVASWPLISRRGLAWAAAVMGLSLVLNYQVWWHSEPPEHLAAQSVVSFVLPR
jgi:hypothetical protein